MPPREDNTQRLRAKIDRGETGDKVAVEDPATAPLGTDAEASGVSSFHQETSHSSPADTKPVGPDRPQAGRARTMIGLAAALIIVILVVIWFLPVA